MNPLSSSNKKSDISELVGISPLKSQVKAYISVTPLKGSHYSETIWLVVQHLRFLTSDRKFESQYCQVLFAHLNCTVSHFG